MPFKGLYINIVKNLLTYILILANILIVNSDINFVSFLIINQCEGKDAGNYTIVGTSSMDDQCESYVESANWLTFVQVQPNGQTSIISASVLVASDSPAGAYRQVDRLMLATSGSLVGKYIYHRFVTMNDLYLKKCSSILGYSYISTKSMSLLISDRLDLNVLISPTGGYEAFKKGCTTVCSGHGYNV